jgi:hypothetical protein
MTYTFTTPSEAAQGSTPAAQPFFGGLLGAA